MKVWHVYELVNSNGIVEYVGESMNLKGRLKKHKSKAGKFNGRTDIEINIVKTFDIRRDAWDYQCILQKQYGFKTDSEILSELKKGKVGTNKGKTFSDEHKKNISEAKINYYQNKNI